MCSRFAGAEGKERGSGEECSWLLSSKSHAVISACVCGLHVAGESRRDEDR